MREYASLQWLAMTALVVALALHSPARAAGGEYSFDRAATSPVDYGETPHRAGMACAALSARADEASALNATVVPAAASLPEHCRIDGLLPTGIGFQINLPTAWNGRIYMFGNGGYAGEDAESPREQASRDLGLKNGFATVRTDTGHLAAQEPLATFAVNSEKLINHGYGAVHATIVYAKKLASAYYGLAPRYAYWDGCSTGGRQGVMAAQRFPADFDGIVANAPTLDWSSIMIKGLWNHSALAHSGLTFDRMGEVFKTVMAQCDDNDGVKDGLIDDPRRCAFDAARHLASCSDKAAGAACFTPAEVAALQKLYAGPPKGVNTPAWVYQTPGFEHPSTLQLFVMNSDGSPDVLTLFAESWMKYIGFRDPAYESSTFDFHRSPALMRGADEIFNPTPDLAAFEARGGKMITAWGWADTALNPQMGIHYYDAVVDRHGLEETQGFYRLFLIPGVAHCSGGYGPDDIDAMTAVINWAEKGIVPTRLSARRTKGGVRYHREYCPYPAATKYKGSGDPEDPRNYVCTTPDARQGP